MKYYRFLRLPAYLELKTQKLHLSVKVGSAQTVESGFTYGYNER